MTVARLGLAVDSSSVVGATTDLDKFVAVADRVGTAADRMRARTTQSLKETGQSAQVISFQTKQTLLQLPDIFQGIAGGQGVFRVALQQGGQLVQVWGLGPGGVAGSIKSVGREMLGMISTTKLLTAGVIGLTVAGIATVVMWRNYASALDDLARSTGTATTTLSALQTAASVKGISSDQFAVGMKQFAASVYDAKAGANDLARLFALNGKSVGDTQAALGQVADLVRNARNDQQRIVILQEAGLPATMEWVRLLRNGADGIKQAQEEAVKFGGTVNDEMIEKARAFDEAWNRTWTNFGVKIRSAVVDVVEYLQRLSDNPIIRVLNKLGEYSPLGLSMEAVGLGAPTPNQVVANRFPSANEFAPTPASGAAGRTRDLSDLAAQQHSLQMEQQRLSLLGDLASVEDRIRLTEISIIQARQQPGSVIKDADVKRIMDYARASENLRRQQEQVAALGGAATDAERYSVTVGELQLKLQAGKITQDQFNRAALEAVPIFSSLKDSFSDFVSGMLTGFAQGQSAAESLKKSLSSIGSQLISQGTKSLTSSLTSNLGSGLASLLGTGASLAGPLGAAASVGIGFVSSLFSANSAKRQAQQQAAQQAAQLAAQTAQQQADAAANYRAQAALASVEINTQAGAFAKLEIQIQQGRAEAARVGGAAVVAYEEYAQAQRLALTKEWEQKIADLRLSYQDRIFAALNDNTTLAGKLAAYDRQAAEERANAIRQYGQVYTELEQAQAAERLRIIRDSLQEQTSYYDNLRNTITNFTQGLQFGNLSTLSPAQQYLAARNNFQTQLAAAQGGDRTALGGITNTAQTLIEQARNYLGPSSEFGDMVNRVVEQLNALPDVAMAADPQVQELQRLVSTNGDMLDALSSISDELEGSRSEARALSQQNSSLVAQNNDLTNQLIDATESLRQELRIGLSNINIRAA